MPRVTWVGHGTALVDLDGVRLLTDPLLRNRVAHLQRPRGAAGGRGPARSRRRPHLAPAPRPSRPALAPPGRARRCRSSSRAAPAACSCGAASMRVREVAPGDEVTIGAVTVQATEAPPSRRPRRLRRARAGARLRVRGHAAHLPRGRHRPLRRHARDRRRRARSRARADLGLGAAARARSPRSAARGGGARAARARAGPCPSTGAPTRSARPRAAARPISALRSRRSSRPRASSRPDVEVVPLEPGESLEL